VLNLLLLTCLARQDQYTGGPLTVRPVFYVTKDASLPPPAEEKLLDAHLTMARDRYAQLLRGDTFQLWDRKAIVLKSQYYSSELEASTDNGQAEATNELLRALNRTRYNAPFVFVVIFVGTHQYPKPMGHTFNGGFGNGGGIVVDTENDLMQMPSFQSALQRSLGEAFGLPTVDAYGYDLDASSSIMSYNMEHESEGLKPSETPGVFIPEDLRGLGLNSWAFSKFKFDPVQDVPASYKIHQLEIQDSLKL
jgi:hypothetical protein